MQRQGSIGGSAANRIRVTGAILLVAHLALVAWLTLRPLDVPWVRPANLRPLAGLRADLALGWPVAGLRIGEGLALLAPLGVLLPMADGRLTVSPLASLFRTAAAGALISLGIALLQTGVPGRVVDVDVLLLNTTGVLLAHLTVVPAGRAWLRRRLGRGGVVEEGYGDRGGRGGLGGVPESISGGVSGGCEGYPAVEARWADRIGGAGVAGPARGAVSVRGELSQGRTPTIPRVGIAP
ncbi:VanZ family protein [Streptomyces seoulensis]|uniref:VanZ family protein n=1 Tax=Streptomyces seoulensis TaxID=73044 RepID=A0A4P6TYT8_STRSO|nr:VanZ family protein [Streptomyces seoulensis]